MHSLRLIAIATVVSWAAGCTDPAELKSLQKQTAELKSQVSELKTSVEELQRTQSWDKFMRDANSVAYLTPGSEGYSVLETDLGRMTVALADVKGYANGTRVKLRFGNLTSATINGAKAKLEWGKVDDKGSPKNDEARSRDVSFNESLRAGAWTDVEVVLEGVPPNEFGFVRVRDVTHTGIRLFK